MENGDERAARTPDSDPAVTPEQRKKATLRDLARYRVGQKAYWIVFRSDGRPDFQRSEDWMRDEHPWILWRRKVLPWDVSMRPPRAHQIVKKGTLKFLINFSISILKNDITFARFMFFSKR